MNTFNQLDKIDPDPKWSEGVMMGNMDPITHILEIKGRLGEMKVQMETAESERQDAKQTQREINQKLDQITQRIAMTPDDEHKEHHDFMKQMIEKEKRKQETYDAIRNKILTGGAWAFVCGVGMLFWYAFKDVILKKAGG